MCARVCPATTKFRVARTTFFRPCTRAQPELKANSYLCLVCLVPMKKLKAAALCSLSLVRTSPRLLLFLFSLSLSLSLSLSFSSHSITEISVNTRACNTLPFLFSSIQCLILTRTSTTEVFECLNVDFCKTGICSGLLCWGTCTSGAKHKSAKFRII